MHLPSGLVWESKLNLCHCWRRATLKTTTLELTAVYWYWSMSEECNISWGIDHWSKKGSDNSDNFANIRDDLVEQTSERNRAEFINQYDNKTTASHLMCTEVFSLGPSSLAFWKQFFHETLGFLPQYSHDTCVVGSPIASSFGAMPWYKKIPPNPTNGYIICSGKVPQCSQQLIFERLCKLRMSGDITNVCSSVCST